MARAQKRPVGMLERAFRSWGYPAVRPGVPLSTRPGANPWEEEDASVSPGRGQRSVYPAARPGRMLEDPAPECSFGGPGEDVRPRQGAERYS